MFVLSVRNHSNATCLHLASVNGHVDVCRVLLHDKRVDVEAVDNDYW